MSNFWEGIKESTGTVESASSGLIPDGTELLAAITDISWQTFENDTFISATWSVLKPEEYKNRKVFQKLRVLDEKESRSRRAKDLLAAIDKNASNGKLFLLDHQPTDQDMTKYLVNKPMVIMVNVWEMNGKQGNYVDRVSPRKSGAVTAAPKPDAVEDIDGEDVPF